MVSDLREPGKENNKLLFFVAKSSENYLKGSNSPSNDTRRHICFQTMLPLLKTLHKLLHDNKYIQTTMLLVIAGSVSSLFNAADTGTLDKND